MGARNANLLEPGYLLHWYRIDIVLGQGGFGITYLAEDQNLQEKVAIKEYFPAQFAGRAGDGSVQQLSESHTDNYQWGLDRFLGEARTLTQCRHPSIVRVRSVFEDNNTAYMVMDFEKGVTFADYLKGKQILSEETLLALFSPLMDGLAVIHEAGFIHRDIKPDNIIVKENGAVLIDFGAARQAVGERNVSITRITSAGYAPFEQYHGRADQQGPWTDIYAMGATLYRAITGIAPPQAVDRSKALLETARDTYASVRECCSDDYSISFLGAIDHALAFRAVERPQSVAEWRAEIRNGDSSILEGEAPTGLVRDKGQWSLAERTQIKQQLADVLASRSFESAPQLQRLLSYLLEETLAGRGDRLNQASIAIDALGKDTQFDAATDSAVRVEARRLRSRLIEYYYGEGRQDAIRFALPKGHYLMTITFGPEPDKTGVVDSIKSVSYRIRGESRSQLSSFFWTRPLVYFLVGAFAVAVLFMFYDQSAVTDKEGVSTGIEAQAPPIKAARPIGIPDQKSIAVLPFANHSAVAEEAAFFADGLHDDLLTQLTKIKDMTVISGTSVMRYRGTTKPIAQIAGELHVAMIMEGSVQRAGDRLRVNVQLIDAAADKYLWAKSYDQVLTTANIFDIQRDIAMKAATTLQSTITAEEQQRLAMVPTDNLEAYEAYLSGKQRMAGRSTDGMSNALDYFQQAIALDPTFALAYLGLADSYLLQINHSGLAKDEMLAKAEVTIYKALALDDTSGEAYASLGLLKDIKGDQNGAEVAYQKALALNPNYAATYNWYGVLKFSQDKREEALALHRKGAQLNPLFVVLNANIANDLEKLGRFDEALVQHEKVIEIAPASPLGYWGKADYYWSVTGQLDEAVRWNRKAYALDPDHIQTNILIANIYWDLGDDSQAECWVNRALEVAPESFYSNEAIQLFVYLQRGDEDRALAYAHKVLKFWPRWPWPYSLAALRNYDLRAGRYSEARDRYLESFPELLAKDQLRVDGMNFRAAIDLAAVLLKTGEQERAAGLLNAGIKYIQGNQRLGRYGYGVRDVDIYALQGKTQQALSAMRQTINAGWRVRWRYHLEYDPNLNSIRNEPKFQSMVKEVKADMAEQLAQVRKMEREEDDCINP